MISPLHKKDTFPFLHENEACLTFTLNFSGYAYIDFKLYYNEVKTKKHLKVMM